MIAKPKLITAPVLLPVGLEEVKTYLRVDGSTEDSLITAAILSATIRLEEMCERKFVTQTWDIYFDYFAGTHKNDWWDGEREGAISMLYSPIKHIDLPFGPLQSVTGFYTYDDDGTEYEFSSSSYVVDTISPQGRVSLKLGQTWPSTVLRATNGIKIRGVFGYGVGYTVSPAAASLVPVNIQQAILLTVGKIYENRGDSQDAEFLTIPNTAMMLLGPYMKVKV